MVSAGHTHALALPPLPPTPDAAAFCSDSWVLNSPFMEKDHSPLKDRASGSKEGPVCHKKSGVRSLAKPTPSSGVDDPATAKSRRVWAAYRARPWTFTGDVSRAPNTLNLPLCIWV